MKITEDKVKKALKRRKGHSAEYHKEVKERKDWGQKKKNQNKMCPPDLVATDLNKRNFNKLVLMEIKLKQDKRMAMRKTISKNKYF